MVVIIIYFICSNQWGECQVKDMNVYIEPLIDEMVNLRNDITMYAIYRTIRQRKFNFHPILVWTIHDSRGLTHFCGNL